MLWLPNSMSTSQMAMPIQTITNVTFIYRATAWTPNIIKPANMMVSTVAIAIISPLEGAVIALPWIPAT